MIPYCPRPFAPPSPFDAPQLPTRAWRCLGRWRGGGEFLVVLARSRDELAECIDAALAEYSLADLVGMDALWIEAFDSGGWGVEPHWVAIQEVALKPIRYRRGFRRHAAG